MMQSGEAGEKISKIELVNLTPEDVKKRRTPMTDQPVKLPESQTNKSRHQG